MIGSADDRAEPTTLQPRRTLATRRVLGSDPRLAYLLYVPEVLSTEPRLVVSIHGANRNVDVHAQLLAAYAEMYGAVLVVPHFSTSRYGDYQRLGRIGRGKRADLALHRIVTEAGALTGMPADRLYLFGFSAGAQFVHRYAMAYPHRVAFAAFADAGRYTLPDPKQKFPRGIGSNRKLPGLRFDPDLFLRVPMKVFVGAHEPEDQVVTLPRREQEGASEKGVRRAERARQWVAAMQQAGRERRIESAIAWEELPDRIRSFRSSVLRAGLAERAFEAMFGALPPQPDAASAPLPSEG
ncbi:MAG: PHB depolymerase family esterase [Candidatus Eisenbacteria bacterium]